MAYVELDLYKKYNDGTFQQLPGGTIVNPPGGLPNVPAISGTDFHNSYGIRVFPTYHTKTYDYITSTTEGGSGTTANGGPAWLTDLRPGFITHSVFPNLPGNDPIWDTWAPNLYEDYGISTYGCTVGQPHWTYNTADWNSMMARIASMGAAVKMVNGQNEVNHVRNGYKLPDGTPLSTLPSNWKQTAANHQIALWNKVQALNAQRAALPVPLDPILVGNCNLWAGNLEDHDADAAIFIPMIKGYVDCINYHLYPRGDNPDYRVDQTVALYRDLLGDTNAELPVVCTEAGYFTPTKYSGGSNPSSEWAQNIYSKKLWLEYALRGYAVSQFEFLDDPDSSEADREAHFGLINVSPSTTAPSGWSAKPSYNSLQTWLAIDGGSTGTVPVLIEAAGTSPVSQLVVKQQPDGPDKLFLWRDLKLENYNNTTKVFTPITPSPATVSVTVTSAANPTGTTVLVGTDVVEVTL